jgi:hypothetical protein
VPIVQRLLTEQNVAANAEASLYELDFAVAAVSAFGGACDDQGRDYRAEFSQMRRNVTFLEQGTAFDYDFLPRQKYQVAIERHGRQMIQFTYDFLIGRLPL